MSELRTSPAPSIESFPTKRLRSSRASKELTSISLGVQVVTPILGGSAQPREVDEVDVIRVPTIRGHLRFWWRALYGHQFSTPGELFREESGLWGTAAGDEGGRSAVELSVWVDRRSLSRDLSDIKPESTTGAYALWPARAERGGKSAAPRYEPGLYFSVQIVVPEAYEAIVSNSLRAWILFGGYGSRTRRGLGSLTVVEQSDKWLPGAASRDEFERLFGWDIFSPDEGQLTPTDMPVLAGSWLGVGLPVPDATQAWTTALGWLEKFRQGTEGRPGERAREPGTTKKYKRHRPSVSNWPEADKIRHLLSREPSSHCPRHNETPVWPRAGFGLPIIGRFETRGRRRDEEYQEPGPFELRWRSMRDAGGEEHDRLASPLIVKALPLAGGNYVPCALWLNRRYPEGEVYLKGVENSGAPFDLLVAPGDSPRFSALEGKASLREAFMDWLKDRYSIDRIAPQP